MNRRKVRMFFFCVTLALGCYCGTAEDQLTGKASKIIDGDTFDLLLTDKTTRRIRLFEIDCPERTQAYYRVAKDHLGTLLRNATLTVEIRDTDRYGRTVGIVWANQQNVNEAMLSAGLAWHYTRYDNTPQWQVLENTARQNRAGLWADPHAVAPWLFKSPNRTPAKKQDANR